MQPGAGTACFAVESATNFSAVPFACPLLNPPCIDVIAPTATITPTPTETQNVLPTPTPTNTHAFICAGNEAKASYFIGPFSAVSSGNVMRADVMSFFGSGLMEGIDVYIFEPGPPGSGFRAAVYSNNTGIPDVLLTETGVTTLQPGWNFIPCPPIILNQPAYWIAFQADAGVSIAYKNSLFSMENSVHYAFSFFPAVFPGPMAPSNTDWTIYPRVCVFTPTVTETSVLTGTATQTPTEISTQPPDTATLTPTWGWTWAVTDTFTPIATASRTHTVLATRTVTGTRTATICCATHLLRLP